MPGYGIRGPFEGGGLLPWRWAEDRLTSSRSYWVGTAWPDGRPHSMPVWGVWDAGAFWFSSGLRSRKARNVAADPRCVVTTEDATEPVIVEGEAGIVTDERRIARFVEAMNAKYDAGMTIGFQDPAVNVTIRVRPRRAFGIAQGDFTGSATRWQFI
jgi:PPOX class probable F420-dependent enzyme